MYILSGAYEPPEGRKERPTPHYSVERHLNLNGRDTSLIWTYSQVGRKCCFHSQRAMAPRYKPRVRVNYTALYTRLYFLRGLRSRKGQSAECGILHTFAAAPSVAYIGLFTGICGVVACRFPSLSIPRSLFLASSL